MKHLTLTRYWQDDECTIGLLKIQGQKEPYFYTLENPWLNNQEDVSCIPDGTYVCKPFSGTQYKDVYQVMDVEERTYVLLHWGNYPRNTQGCILVGEYQKSMIDGVDGRLKKAIANSRSAFNKLRNEIGQESFKLTIIGGTTNWG